ncbi:UNVERIFIED_CONTAM: methyltransferase family protein [Acetivibrio alkalicellulosi]
MNKQILSKLSLFLSGLEQRLNENIEYFKKITFVFKSGTKEYAGIIVVDKNMLKINFNTNIYTFQVGEFTKEINRYAQNYESLILTYEERGSSIYIEADHKNVKMKSKDYEEQVREVQKSHSETHSFSNRDYYIKVGKANQLLKEIGILSSSGKIKNDMIRKYNQIDHFIELIDSMLKELCEKHDSITVLDCGCGKSYLLFVLNYYIREVLKKPCHFIGLDYSETVIEASKNTAQNLGYKNMEFQSTDIKNYHPKRKIHFVISLHACNTATDEAIALAVKNKVEGLAVVPCCQQEILSQYSFKPLNSIIKHGVLKTRIADVITDGVRSLLLEVAGYKTSVVEYVSPIDTPKNLMIKAIKNSELNVEKLEEYKELKNLLSIEPTLEKLILK